MKPSDRILKRFIPRMEREGFTYRKSGHRFVKPFSLGQCQFSLTFDARGGFTAVAAGFFLHHDALLKHFKRAVGRACPWTAGATILNAGADPWKIWLCDDRYANMTPQERAGIPSDVIHPQSKIEEGLAHLDRAYHEYATPLFDALPTYRRLATFYREYLESGCMQRCRPLRQNVVYLSLILAAARGDNANRILDLAAPTTKTSVLEPNA
ncbi:MAG: hypothetical protein H8E66_21440 [Planctomycetes bacterium]|nr:hypothetical protein [Planctomycetota bacterium]